MMVLIIILVILAILTLWIIARYNSFIRLKNLINEAWSGIDIQLKRRYDLIPNLVSTVKGYSEHEKGVFEQVTRLRATAMHANTIQEKSDAEIGLSQALKTLFAVAENYPELKANQNFNDLQKELSNIENHLQLSRRYYNGVVRDYNTMIQVFPSSIVASIMNFQKAPYFELTSSVERETPQVKF